MKSNYTLTSYVNCPSIYSQKQMIPQLLKHYSLGTVYPSLSKWTSLPIFLAGRSTPWVSSEQLLWIHGDSGAKLPTSAAERHAQSEGAKHIDNEGPPNFMLSSFLKETRQRDCVLTTSAACALCVHVCQSVSRFGTEYICVALGSVCEMKWVHFCKFLVLYICRSSPRF